MYLSKQVHGALNADKLMNFLWIMNYVFIIVSIPPNLFGLMDWGTASSVLLKAMIAPKKNTNSKLVM